MLATKWDVRFLNLARHVAQWSKDPSTKCGAVITHGRRIVSLGFNGPPAGTSDAPGVFEDRAEKLRRTLHAEQNALAFANQDVSGAAMYVTAHPCSQCAAHIIQRGIETVIYVIDAGDAYYDRWGASIDSAADMFSEAGVLTLGIPVEVLDAPLSEMDAPCDAPVMRPFEVIVRDGDLYDRPPSETPMMAPIEEALHRINTPSVGKATPSVYYSAYRNSDNG